MEVGEGGERERGLEVGGALAVELRCICATPGCSGGEIYLLSCLQGYKRAAQQVGKRSAQPPGSGARLGQQQG